MSNIIVHGVAPAGGGGGGGDDGKPPKKSAVEVVKALQAAAKAGNKAALAELVRLRTMIKQAAATQAAMIQVLDEPDLRPEVVSGEDLYAEEEIFGKDGIDHADHVLRQMQNADGLTKKAALQASKATAQAAVANWARITPPSINRGILGNAVTLNQAQSTLDVVRWIGDDEETLPVTVTVGAIESVINNPLLSAVVRPFATIQWGTKGMMFRVEVDCLQGVQLTLSGSAIVVQVGSEVANSVGNALKMAGMISFYPIEKANSANRTRYITAAAAAAGATVVVPPFASTIFVERGNSGAASATVSILDSAGTSVATYVIAAGSQQDEPIPLPGDAAQVTVLTSAAAETRVIFGLSM